MRYEITTSGKFDSIPLAEARLHVKEASNITVEDDLIVSYIKTADKLLENKTNRVISSTTFTGWLDKWPTGLYPIITINKNPVSSITSVQYYDGDNALQTMVEGTDYFVDKVSSPARIYLTTTPALYTRPNAIKIIFVSGYSTQEAVDERIKHFARMMCADYKQYRSDSVTGTILTNTPRTVEYLLNQLRIDEL